MIVLGVHSHPAQGDGARRQADALAAMRDLPGVRRVNLQWPDEVAEIEGYETLAILRKDSHTVSGRTDGPRKPIATEIFDALADAARESGARWFVYTNSDARVSAEAVERIESLGLEGCAFSRMDFEGATGRDLGLVLNGIDTFAVDVDWWRANRRRFRDYPVGEPVWDNVFTSILLCHARARLLNRGPLVRHEAHPAGWRESPFARYVALLAARDRIYFSLWARYYDALLRLRERGAPEDEELELQRRIFRYAPSPAARVVQALRVARATLRYAIQSRGG